MTVPEANGPNDTTRAIWALGDYHAVARQTVWDVGRELVEAAGIGPGQRVLDIGAGSGNAAIRAAEEGAQVVASDVAPANFAAGREEARQREVQLEWVEADAQRLPFADGQFDTVMSVFGAILAPDQRAAADEMLRVCRSGGTIAMANFPPRGLAAMFFELLGRYAPPPPPGAPSPLMWGAEDHVRDLFGDRVTSLEASKRIYFERAASPAEYVRLYRENFGPAVAIYQGLAEQPDRRAALERDFLEFAERANGAPAGAPAAYPYEYLLVIARRR